MGISPCLASGAAVLAAMLLAPEAFAQDEPWPGTESAPGSDSSEGPVPAQGILLDGWIGAGASSVVHENGDVGRAALGATALYHDQAFELGGGLTADGVFLVESSFLLTALAGLKTEPVPWARLELLAEGGLDAVSGLGSGVFDHVQSGGSATLPYVGARAGASLLTGRTHGFVVGLWVMAGNAVGSVGVQSTVSNCLLYCDTRTEHFTLGGWNWASGMRFGGDLTQW